MDSESRARWLTLARLPGLGPRGRIALLEHVGSVEALFAADRRSLEAALAREALAVTGRIDARAVVGAVSRGPAPEAVAADLAWLEQEGHDLLTWTDADYPPLLREIPDPPPVLYVHGRRELLARAQLAIVGSRNPTALGRENAAGFARALTEAGLVITSGLALGIDTAAHREALAAGGATVAVAGTGLDRIYPPSNHALAREIAAHGALVSEFPIGTPARAGNFPVRNRIISGLSLGVLVVEAAERSGSLITARLAGEQGREVFALPGSIHSPLARGCHALIRQGAKLVETAAHVLEELPALAQVSFETPPPAPRAPPLAALERRLLDSIGYEPTHIDALVDRTGLTANTVSAILLELELRGLVLAGPGGYQRAPVAMENDERDRV